MRSHNSHCSPLVSDKACNSRHDYLNSSGIYDEALFSHLVQVITRQATIYYSSISQWVLKHWQNCFPSYIDSTNLYVWSLMKMWVTESKTDQRQKKKKRRKMTLISVPIHVSYNLRSTKNRVWLLFFPYEEVRCQNILKVGFDSPAGAKSWMWVAMVIE